MITIADTRLAVIGLGYVGLPLAVEFGKKMDVLGFDTNQQRVDELISGRDGTLEVSEADLAEASRPSYSANVDELIKANVYIVSVPTPIDKNKNPDLTPLISASRMLGKVIREDDVVIYKSTVYPGATEEDCIPITEEVLIAAGSKWNFTPFRPALVDGYSTDVNPYYLAHKTQEIGYIPEMKA